MFLVSLAGINANDVNKLRVALRQAGARMRVVKNRLAKRAADAGEVVDITDLFRGPTAVVYHAEEPIATAKALVDFAKDHPALQIKGGLVGRAEAVDGAGVKAVAEMPTLDEARAMLLGLFQTPARQLLQLFNAPGTQLATLLQKKADGETQTE
jgi:large subunit ribosomal protein L10